MEEKITRDAKGSIIKIEYICSEEEKAEFNRQFYEERRRVARRPLIGVVRDAYWGYKFEESRKVLDGTLLADLAGIKANCPKPKWWSEDWSNGAVSVWEGETTYFGPENKIRTERLFDEDFVPIEDCEKDKIYQGLGEAYRQSRHEEKGFRRMFEKKPLHRLIDIIVGAGPYCVYYTPGDLMHIELMEQVLVEAKHQIEEKEMTKKAYERLKRNLDDKTLFKDIHSEITKMIENKEMGNQLLCPHFVYGHVPWLRHDPHSGF